VMITKTIKTVSKVSDNKYKAQAIDIPFKVAEHSLYRSYNLHASLVSLNYLSARRTTLRRFLPLRRIYLPCNLVFKDLYGLLYSKLTVITEMLRDHKMKSSTYPHGESGRHERVSTYGSLTPYSRVHMHSDLLSKGLTFLFL